MELGGELKDLSLPLPLTASISAVLFALSETSLLRFLGIHFGTCLLEVGGDDDGFGSHENNTNSSEAFTQCFSSGFKNMLSS